MTSLHLNITHINQQIPSATIIPRIQLAQLLEADDVIKRSRHKAAALLQKARQHRQVLYQRYQQRLDTMFTAAEAERDVLFAEAKLVGAAAALDWLVEQNSWQQQFYEMMVVKISQQLAERLQIITSQISWDNILAEQSLLLLEEFRSQQNLSLRVGRNAIDQLTKQLAAYPVVIIEDKELAGGEAILENELVRVVLKLPQQLNSLIEKLKRLTWEQLHEPD